MDIKRKVSDAIIGLCLGIIIYLIIFKSLQIPVYVHYILAILVCVICAIGTLISVQFCCISLLTLPTVFGNSGRSLIRTWIVINLLNGPIDNLARNGNQIIKLTSCSIELNYNLTESRYKLMYEPLVKAVVMLGTKPTEVDEVIGSVDGIIAPITEQIHGKTIERSGVDNKTYVEVLRDKCDAQLSKAQDKCANTFATQFDKCLHLIPVFGLAVCWITKIANMCDVYKSIGIQDVCDPSMHIDPNINDEHSKLTNDVESLRGGFDFPNVTYKINHVNYDEYLHDIDDASKLMTDKLSHKQSYLTHAVSVIRILYRLIFFRILLNAQSFHNKYLKDITYENYFVTRSLVEFDRTAPHRLNLHLVEKQLVKTPYSKNYKRAQCSLIFQQSLKLSLEVIMVTILIIIDRLLYESLDVIKSHGTVLFLQRGYHHLSIKVEGTGMMARLVRSIINGVNIHQILSILKNNQECLPVPTRVNPGPIFMIYFGFLIIALITFVQIYTVRIQNYICGRFYPKRDAMRTMYLHNELTISDRSFMNTVRDELMKSPEASLFSRLLNRSSFLRRRWMKCVICGDVKILLKDAVWWECPVSSCRVVYCAKCREIMSGSCLVCVRDGSTNKTN